jgi:hypothetical protein
MARKLVNINAESFTETSTRKRSAAKNEMALTRGLERWPQVRPQHTVTQRALPSEKGSRTGLRCLGSAGDPRTMVGRHLSHVILGKSSGSNPGHITQHEWVATSYCTLVAESDIFKKHLDNVGLNTGFVGCVT